MSLKTNKKAETKTNKKDESFIKVKVLRAHDFSTDNETVIAFDCDVNAVVRCYNLVYRSGSKNGKEYSFVSFPSRKDKDGKYWNHVWFNINEEHLKDIENQLDVLLNGSDI